MLGFNRTPSQEQTIPVEEAVRCALESTRFTPDIHDLERSETQRVFIYNEMKSGHRASVMLPDPYVVHDATCYTDAFFWLYKKRLGLASRAIALDESGTWFRPDWDQVYGARIQGELCIIKSSHIPILDEFHKNTVEFTRKRVKILRPWRNIVRAKDGYPLNGEHLESLKAKGIVHSMRGCGTMDAWIYLGNKEYWSEQLSRMFTPTKLYTSPNEGWLKEYYSFTQKEYEG